MIETPPLQKGSPECPHPAWVSNTYLFLDRFERLMCTRCGYEKWGDPR